MMKRLRLAFALTCLPVGCSVDEDTNSASGSFIEITLPAGAPGGVTVDDVDGSDGVLVDCSSLFDSKVSVTSGDIEVSVTFDAGTEAGARLELPANATVVVRAGDAPFDIVSGAVVVDANDNGLDLRVSVTLDAVTASDGRVVTGTLDCLETAGDTNASSCASAGSGGGGGDDDDD